MAQAHFCAAFSLYTLSALLRTEYFDSSCLSFFSRGSMTMRSFTPLSPLQVRKGESGRSIIFKLASRALKYYLLMLFGFSVSLVLAGTMGFLPVIEPSLPAIGEWLWRLAVIILCFGAIAVVLESIRQ